MFENSGYSYRIVENQIVIYTTPTTTVQQTVQQKNNKSDRCSKRYCRRSYKRASIMRKRIFKRDYH
ncbi:hypothetical protein NXY14_23855 [Bacteroides fragilis]|nr:hypothetical protein [Bacteroides fragilis]